MDDRESPEDGMLIFHYGSGPDGVVDQVQRWSPGAEDHVHQHLDSAHGRLPGENLHRRDHFPAPKSGNQPAQAQDVIEMTMGDEDFADFAEPKAAA